MFSERNSNSISDLYQNYLKIMGLIFVSIFFVFFISCELDVEKDDWLNGYWKSSYNDGFEINGNSYNQYDDSAKTISFKGDIVEVIHDSSISGRVIIKITESGSWGKTVGKYLVLSYKNLKNNTVKQATAYKIGSSKNECDTKDEAITEQTESNGYYSYYGDYIRQ